MRDKKLNLILLADCYKFTHWRQLKGRGKIEKLGSYIESRGSDTGIPYIKVFGIQGFIKEYLEGNVIEQWMIDEASFILGQVFDDHTYFNKDGFTSMFKKYGGRLPIKIKAVKEGIKVPLKNITTWIESTDPEFEWIVPWIETMLLRAAWYGTTVCTISSYVYDLQKKYGAICGANYNPFFLNDFGARGVSSHESAEIGGAAHLVNSLGTDTVECLPFIIRNYAGSVCGYSVYASEHSTTTIFGKENEVKAYTHMLNDVPPDKICSLVNDSYSQENMVKVLIGKELKDKVLSRSAPTVIRPDSGDPVEMSLKNIQWLWEIFGGTINEK